MPVPVIVVTVVKIAHKTKTPAMVKKLVLLVILPAKFLNLKLNKMKKQANLPATGKKLSLNKKTISNLNEMEMNKKVGGSYGHWPTGITKRNTCYGHKTR